MVDAIIIACVQVTTTAVEVVTAIVIAMMHLPATLYSRHRFQIALLQAMAVDAAMR